MHKKIIIGISGASGSVYAKRLIEVLLDEGWIIEVVFSKMAKKIWKDEVGTDFIQLKRENLIFFENDDFYAPIASGSHRVAGMVILPASMGVIGRIAHGISDSLITRAADVALKEKRTLIVVPRETPFSRIHLKNMLELSDAGATILPASPAFYNQPKQIAELVDFVIARILDHLNIEHNLIKRWGEK